MTALWIVLVVGVLLGFLKGIGWWYARTQPPGLGFVSAQWIAEQRVSQAQHRQR